jgi:hypothetical protein
MVENKTLRSDTIITSCASHRLPESSLFPASAACESLFSSSFFLAGNHPGEVAHVVYELVHIERNSATRAE